MKDQVDGLRECGYPAAALYSGMPSMQFARRRRKSRREYRLVFVAPERLLTPRFLQLVERLQVRAFAIDEAHCISHWGHDFRPEYRQLAELKTPFPGSQRPCIYRNGHRARPRGHYRTIAASEPRRYWSDLSIGRISYTA